MRKSSTEVILICVLTGLCLSTTVCLAKSIVKEKPSLPKAGVVKDASFYKILPPDFSIAVSPLSIEFRKTGTLNVEVIRSGGFDGDVSVTLSNLPVGVTTPKLNMMIPAGTDTGRYLLTATSVSKFETGKMVTIEGSGSLNGKDTTRSATAKVSVLRVVGDFRAVYPILGDIPAVYPNTWSQVRSRDGNYRAEINGTNPFRASLGGLSFPFSMGPLGGVCFNYASTCFVVLSGQGTGTYGFSSELQYTIVWLNSWPSPPVLQKYQVNLTKGSRTYFPQLQFSPDGSLALLSAVDTSGPSNYQVHLIDIIGARMLAALPANLLTGGTGVYPSAKVYLSGGKTKVDVTFDGTTKTLVVP